MGRKAFDAHLLEPAYRDEFRCEPGSDSFFESPTHIAVRSGFSHASTMGLKYQNLITQDCYARLMRIGRSTPTAAAISAAHKLDELGPSLAAIA